MKSGDTVYINNKVPATIKCFLANHKVVVTFGASCRYTTYISNISNQNGRLVLNSDIFKF